MNYLSIEEYLDPTSDAVDQDFFVRVALAPNIRVRQDYVLSVVEDAGLAFDRQVGFRHLSVTIVVTDIRPAYCCAK